jgi:hypothetical protein
MKTRFAHKSFHVSDKAERSTCMKYESLGLGQKPNLCMWTCLSCAELSNQLLKMTTISLYLTIQPRWTMETKMNVKHRAKGSCMMLLTDTRRRSDIVRVIVKNGLLLPVRVKERFANCFEAKLKILLAPPKFMRSEFF